MTGAGVLFSSCASIEPDEEAFENAQARKGKTDTEDWGGLERRHWQKTRDEDRIDVDELHEWNQGR
ncbi:MAG: hypothetical protein ACSHYF_06965 [Verrucomicrobiaceae bacterium]